MDILSPMARGNGAYVVHRTLERHLPGYRVAGYSPALEYFPFLMPLAAGGGRADIIHTTPDHAVFFARRNTPLVVTFHNFVLDRYMRAYSTLAQRIHYRTDLRYFTRKALERADVVTSVSRFTAGLVREEMGYRGEIRVIHNGIDLERFRPASARREEGPVRVLFAGNLTRRKGADLLPGIARRLGKDVIIQYAGGLRGGTGRFVTGEMVDLGVVAYERMPEVYRNSDILLLPTVREGFVLVVAEAMASGLPVVATDCSSMPELVIEGRGGFLCRAGNVDEFAERINTLAADPGLRERMGRFNRARMERHFSLAAMVAGYRDLFAGLAGRA